MRSHLPAWPPTCLMIATTPLDSSILVIATMTRRLTGWAHRDALKTLNALERGRALIINGARERQGVTFHLKKAAKSMS